VTDRCNRGLVHAKPMKFEICIEGTVFAVSPPSSVTSRFLSLPRPPCTSVGTVVAAHSRSCGIRRATPLIPTVLHLRGDSNSGTRLLAVYPTYLCLRGHQCGGALFFVITAVVGALSLAPWHIATSMLAFSASPFQLEPVLAFFIREM